MQMKKFKISEFDVNELPDLLLIGEVARMLRISELTVKRWEKSEKLIPLRINTRGDRRYKKEDVMRIVNGEAYE